MFKRSLSFGAVAENYQKYRGSYDIRVYKLLAKILGGPNKKYRILDIGCGTGKSTEPLVKIFKDSVIIGGDPDKGMLKVAKKSAKEKSLKIKYKQTRAEEMPFNSGYFDAIIAGTAFHWFSTKKAIKEIKRTLKPEGIFFVFWRRHKEDLINFSELRKKYKIKSFVNKYKNNNEFLVDTLKKLGFRDVKTEKVEFKSKTDLKKMIEDIKTNSFYLAMSAKKREEYLSDVENNFLSIAGTNKTITQNGEVLVAYGKK